MKPVYHSIEQMLDLIDEPNRSGCQQLLADNHKLFQTVQGSTHNHQNWPGGYLDHVQEIMNIAVVLHERLNSIRPLPFSLSDLLLVVYLHDIEKPWKYELGVDGHLQHKPTMRSKKEHQMFRLSKAAQYGIVLYPEHCKGIYYAEGELDDYSNRRRVMSPLACVAHMCDVASARLWFDHPMEANDPWPGAKRIRA
jgi:hypothetical protein